MGQQNKEKHEIVGINEEEEEVHTFKMEKDQNGQNTLTLQDGSLIPINTEIPSLNIKKTKSKLLKKTKTPKIDKKDKKKEKEDDDSPWDEDSDSNGSNSSDEDGSDSSSSGDTDSSSSDDSNTTDDEEESSGDFGDVAVNVNDLNTRFDDIKDGDDESEESDESDWVDEEEEMAANNQYGGNQNQLDAIHQILKKLDENITHLQHFGDVMDENEKVLNDPQREQAMVNELTKLNAIFAESPQLIGQCIKTAIIPIMEMLSIPSEDVKCTALETMNIIISDPKEGQQHLQTLCLVQLIPAIGNMVRVRSIKIKNAAAPFLKKFCEDPNMDA